LLFAGTVSRLSFSYSIFNINTVKKLKLRNKSAGNIIVFNYGTSETLRNEVVISTENIKSISDHVPKHTKSLNDEQFGYYLAGIIDGDGHFSSNQQLVIVFHLLDVSLAYFIKKRIGYGNVKKVKDKNAYLYILSSKDGIKKVLNLINGKIRTESKLNQIYNNILSHNSYMEISKIVNFKLNSNKCLSNY
jgi:hypothetical protein